MCWETVLGLDGGVGCATLRIYYMPLMVRSQEMSLMTYVSHILVDF